MALVRYRFELGRRKGVDCWVFQTSDANGRDLFWFKLDDFSTFLKYDLPQEKFQEHHVMRKWKTTWSILKHLLRKEESQSFNWDPNTPFVLEPGLNALFTWSESKHADKMIDWMYEAVFPSLRDNGQLKVEIKKREARIAELKKQIEKLNEQLLAANKEILKALEGALSISHRLADIAKAALSTLTSEDETTETLCLNQDIPLAGYEKPFFPFFTKR